MLTIQNRKTNTLNQTYILIEMQLERIRLLNVSSQSKVNSLKPNLNYKSYFTYILLTLRKI